MIYEFDSREALHEAWLRDKGLCGPSPGGAAASLGLGRQAIYNAVKRGTLDMVRLSVPGENGKLRVNLYIPQSSIERYRRDSLGRKGSRPGFRQRALMAKDKYIGGVWPIGRE